MINAFKRPFQSLLVASHKAGALSMYFPPFVPPFLVRVRQLQLFCICMTVVPKCLLEMFKQYVVVCKDFETVGTKDGKVIWTEEQKPWLIARMKKVKNFSCREVTDKAVEEWDVSALCAALLAVTGTDVAEKVVEVRDVRNHTCHRIGAETSLDDFKGGVQTVKSLIEHANTDFPNLRVWAGYLKDLDSASLSEFHLCHVMIHTVISGFTVLPAIFAISCCI